MYKFSVVHLFKNAKFGFRKVKALPKFNSCKITSKFNFSSVQISKEYNKYKYSYDIESVFDMLKFCDLEPRHEGGNIRLKYCPVCEKPHNDEFTNMNTCVIYKATMVYHCYRCANRGHIARLIKTLAKQRDLSHFTNLIRKGDSQTGTENEEYEPVKTTYNQFNKQNGPNNQNNQNIQEIKESLDIMNETPQQLEYPKASYSAPTGYNISNMTEFKTSINNAYLIQELNKRNLLLENPKCEIIKDYLINERKISMETLKFYNVGVSFEKFKNSSFEHSNLPCVTFPMFYPIDPKSYLKVDKNDLDENTYKFYKCDQFFLARMKVRAIGKEFKQFQRIEPSGGMIWGLFGMDTVPESAEEIILTEGEYDAMAAYQTLKIPAVSLPNGATNLPTQILPFFKKFKKIYLWMDADQAGAIASDSFSKKLGENKTLIINTRKFDPNGPKDANDALKEGKDMFQYLKQSKPLSGDNIIKPSDIRAEVIQFLSQYERYSGYKSTSFSFFNKKLKGLRMGEFSILTGETGSGKTTFLTQLSLDFLKQRVPTLWGSFEIKNDKLASLFLMQYAQKNLRQAQLEELEFYSENFEKLPLYMLKFHGAQSIEEVINTMNYAVYHHDIQNIILDNLQFMVGLPNKVINKFDYQDEIIQRLRKFSTEKNVHVTLVIHPRKSDEMLKISSIFGTAKASQEADNIYILQAFKGVRIIEIAKNRFDGTVGKVAIAFDGSSCRFFELTEDEFLAHTKNNMKIEQIISDRIKKFGSIEPEVKDNSDDVAAFNSKLLETYANKNEKLTITNNETSLIQEKGQDQMDNLVQNIENFGEERTMKVENKIVETKIDEIEKKLDIPQPIKTHRNEIINSKTDEECENEIQQQTDIESISQINSFQDQIFPQTNFQNTFHTPITYDKTVSYSNMRNRINNKDDKVRQSTIKVQNKEKLLEDIF
jgi:twinkle protein